MDRVLLPGEVANPANPPSGCYFHPRCKYAQEICKTTEPVWEEVAPEHYALCHFAKELNLRGVEDRLVGEAAGPAQTLDPSINKPTEEAGGSPPPTE
jgi:peptide/nickel transport system ATP-binding protein